MSCKLTVTENATLSAMAAAIYYEECQADLGEKFVSELEIAYRKIIEHPEYYGYISSQNEFRDIGLNKFPYVVVYQINGDEVIVIDVFNTSKNPKLY